MLPVICLRTKSLSKQLEAINEVYNGGAPMSPTIAKKVLNFFSQKNVILVAPDTVDYHLSEREKEILSLITDGYNFRTIAKDLSSVMKPSEHMLRRYTRNSMSFPAPTRS